MIARSFRDQSQNMRRLTIALAILVLLATANSRDMVSVAEFNAIDTAQIRQYDLKTGKPVRSINLDLPPLLAIKYLKTSPNHDKFFISGVDDKQRQRNFYIDNSTHQSIEVYPLPGYRIVDLSLGTHKQLLMEASGDVPVATMAASLKTVSIDQLPWTTTNSTVNGDVTAFKEFPYLQRLAKFRELGISLTKARELHSLDYTWNNLQIIFTFAPNSEWAYLGKDGSFVIWAGSTPLPGFDIRVEQRHFGRAFIRQTKGRTLTFETTTAPIYSPRVIGQYTLFQTALFHQEWASWLENSGKGIVVFDSLATHTITLPGRLIVAVEGRL